MIEEHAPPRKSRRLRMVLKALGMATAGFLVLVVAAWLIAPRMIRGRLEKQMTKQLGAETTIGRVLIWPLASPAEVRNIAIKSPPGFAQKDVLTCSSLRINLPLSHLLDDPIVIDSVEAGVFTIHAAVNADGVRNYHLNRTHDDKKEEKAEGESQAAAPSPQQSEAPKKKKKKREVTVSALRADVLQVFLEDGFSSPTVQTVKVAIAGFAVEGLERANGELASPTTTYSAASADLIGSDGMGAISLSSPRVVIDNEKSNDDLVYIDSIGVSSRLIGISRGEKPVENVPFNIQEISHIISNIAGDDPPEKFQLVTSRKNRAAPPTADEENADPDSAASEESKPDAEETKKKKDSKSGKKVFVKRVNSAAKVTYIQQKPDARWQYAVNFDGANLGEEIDGEPPPELVVQIATDDANSPNLIFHAEGNTLRRISEGEGSFTLTTTEFDLSLLDGVAAGNLTADIHGDFRKGRLYLDMGGLLSGFHEESDIGTARLILLRVAENIFNQLGGRSVQMKIKLKDANLFDILDSVASGLNAAMEKNSEEQK